MISYDFILQFVSPREILESRIPNAVGFWKAHEWHFCTGKGENVVHWPRALGKCLCSFVQTNVVRKPIHGNYSLGLCQKLVANMTGKPSQTPRADSKPRPKAKWDSASRPPAIRSWKSWNLWPMPDWCIMTQLNVRPPSKLRPHPAFQAGQFMFCSNVSFFNACHFCIRSSTSRWFWQARNRWKPPCAHVQWQQPRPSAVRLEEHTESPR